MFCPSIFAAMLNHRCSPKKVSAIFAEYAGILASEGETETAFKYIKGQGQNGAVLQDRYVRGTNNK